MELRHLRYFIGVAEEENVSRAAHKLRVSQPALSRSSRALRSARSWINSVPCPPQSVRAARKF